MASKDKNGIINAPSPAQGIFEIDINVVSTLTTSLMIELFNPENTQFEIANPGINNYVPISGQNLGAADGAGGLAAIALSGATGDEYMSGVIAGSGDVYVNGAGFVPLGTTNNVCYFDRNGNAVYQPGYLNGVKTVGRVVISAPTAGVSYRQIMNFAKTHDFELHSSKIRFSEANQIGNPLLFKKFDILGQQSGAQVIPSAADSNDQFNPLLINVNIANRMTSNTGIHYTISPYTANGAQTVNFYFFASFISKLTTSDGNGNPRRAWAPNAD